MKWKLTAAMSALITAISILMAAGIYSFMKRDYLAAINNNRLLVVSNLATSAFEALLREDLTSISFFGEHFGRQHDVLSVMVLDQWNKVVYDSRHKLDGSILKGVSAEPESKAIVLDGKEAVEISVPFKIGATKWASARVSFSMDTVNKEVNLIFKTISLFGLLGIAAGVFISSLVARWITLPLNELTSGMNAIEKGDLGYRINIESGDELERVGNEFNSMAEKLKEVQEELLMEEEALRSANHELLDREKELATKNFELKDLNNRLQSFINALEETNKKLKEAQTELLEKEKMAAILELAGAAAHEMNQPLTVIIGNIELLLSHEELDKTKLKNMLETINKAAKEMAAIVKKMTGIKRYETDTYVGKVKILNLNKSSME